MCPPTLPYIPVAESQARVGTGEAAWPMGLEPRSGVECGWGDGKEGRGGVCELRSPSLSWVRDLSSEHPLIILVLFAASLLRPPSPLFSRAERQQLLVRPTQPGADRAARTAHSAARHCACLVSRAPLHQRSKQKHNSSKMGACASQPEDPERGTLDTRRSPA